MNENKTTSYTRLIAVSGVMGALTVLLIVTPLGMVPWFAGVSLTIMQVPVIIAAVLEGPVAGLIVGAVFGVSSLLRAAIAPTSPFDPLFVNPVVSVLPRLCIGLASAFLYKAIKGRENAPRIALGAIAASIGGSLANTVLVLPLLKIFADLSHIAGLTWAVVGSVALLNGLPEAGLSAFLATAVILSWKLVTIGRSKARLADDEERKV